MIMLIWLVVSTHLKNISQIGNLPQIGGENKKYLKPPPSNHFMRNFIHIKLARVAGKSVNDQAPMRLSVGPWYDATSMCSPLGGLLVHHVLKWMVNFVQHPYFSEKSPPVKKKQTCDPMLGQSESLLVFPMQDGRQVTML